MQLCQSFTDSSISAAPLSHLVDPHLLALGFGIWRWITSNFKVGKACPVRFLTHCVTANAAALPASAGLSSKLNQ
jgi:hypothetical protein